MVRTEHTTQRVQYLLDKTQLLTGAIMADNIITAEKKPEEDTTTVKSLAAAAGIARDDTPPPQSPSSSSEANNGANSATSTAAGSTTAGASASASDEVGEEGEPKPKVICESDLCLLITNNVPVSTLISLRMMSLILTTVNPNVDNNEAMHKLIELLAIDHTLTN